MGDKIIITYAPHTGKKGQMQINLDAFFPCTQSALKKLLVIMDLEEYTKKQNIRECIAFIKEKIEIMEADKKAFAKEFQRHHQVMSDVTDEIESGRNAVGLPLTKEQAKENKDKLKAAKAICRDTKRAFEARKRDEVKLTANLNYLRVVALH